MTTEIEVPPFPEFAGMTAVSIAVALMRLAIDIAALTVVSCWVVSRLGGPADLIERALGGALVAIAILTGFILGLGYLGLYSPDALSFLLFGAGIAGAGSLTRWRKPDLLWVKSLWRRVEIAWRTQSAMEQCIATTIVVVLCIYGAIALFTTPLGFDENAYRLPRIAIWLETGSVLQFESGNDRMSFMPIGVDLVQAWLCGHFPRRFPLVAVAGWIGGTVAVLSVLALGRLLVLPRNARLVAALLLLLIPNVQAQFMTAQTDLFTAGLFSAGVYFLWRSLVTRRFNAYAALGLGLACAAKGTAYFIGAGFALVVLPTMLVRPSCRRLLLPHGVALLVFWAVFAFPRHLENILTFGGPFGSAERVLEHVSIGKHVQVLIDTWRDTIAWGVQNLHPPSNPPLLGRPLDRLMMSATERFVSDDPSGVSFDASRQAALRRLRPMVRPDADGVAFGVIPLLLAAVGSISLILVRVGPGRNRVLFKWLLCASPVFGYAVFGIGLAWQVYAHRLLVPLAPFLCVLAVVPLRARHWAAILPFSVAIALMGIGAAVAVVTGVQYGLPASFRATSNGLARYREIQRDVIRKLSSGMRLVVVATDEQSIGGFFRTGEDIAVAPMSPAQAAILTTYLGAVGDRSVAMVLSLHDSLTMEPASGFERTIISVTDHRTQSFAILRYIGPDLNLQD